MEPIILFGLGGGWHPSNRGIFANLYVNVVCLFFLCRYLKFLAFLHSVFSLLGTGMQTMCLVFPRIVFFGFLHLVYVFVGNLLFYRNFMVSFLFPLSGCFD